MARGTAVRNRSESVTVGTPRGAVEVGRQEMRSLRRSGWNWVWMARRAGNVDWHEASTPTEAVRRAILLPARKPPPWLREAAAEAERQLLADGAPDAAPDAAPDGADAPDGETDS
ncbi:MAG TPA: hypothetical protein VGI50_08530 [Solirubrobacteraceae bacterium]|jgi:hypothetical protein